MLRFFSKGPISLLRLFLLISVGIGLVTTSPPVGVDLDLVNLPAWQDWSHPLGCDRLGRDVFSLYSYGILSTILIAVPARILTLVFSLWIALLGYVLGPIVRFLLNQLSYVFLSIPSFLTALLVVAGMGANFFSLPIAILLSD